MRLAALSGLVFLAAAACPAAARQAEPLETALQAYLDHHVDWRDWATFGQALNRATVWLKRDDTAGVEPVFATVPLRNGRRALALYTSRARVEQAFPGEAADRYVALNGSDALARAGPDQPVAVNPRQTPTLAWGPETTLGMLN